jgi:hypothetical protein
MRASNVARTVFVSAVVAGTGLLVLLSLDVTGCQSAHPLDDTDGSSSGRDGLANADHDAGADACAAAGPFSPCRVDSDCQGAYLACTPPDTTLTICRDAQLPVNPACPSPVDLTTVPICPTTELTPFNVCTVRYQRPCQRASDCGPAGFTCNAGICQEAQAGITCTTASDCPNGWDCYAACACPGVEEAKACEPPFAEFRCPGCMPTPG